MRNLMSYGIALLIIIIGGVWMATGVLVKGGQGPGKGEHAVVSLFEEDGGPMSETIDGMGLTHEGNTAESGEVDPALTIAERNEKQANNGESSLRSVRIKTFTARPMVINVPLRGRTEAYRNISASAQTSGTVESMSVTKGDTVATGDVLCTLDQGTRAASVAQAKASLAQSEAALARAQSDLRTNTTLRDKGLSPANSGEPLQVAVKGAEASVEGAKAGLDQAQAELDRTVIKAKVDGIVQSPMASVGTLLNAGGVCATIVQLDPIVFVGSVPEARIGLARLGLPVSIETITGDKAEGKVSFISATADVATRTFEVEVEIDNPGNKIRDGLTADATVNVGTIPAQLLPQSVLTLDDEGVLGIRAVKDSKVAFYKITIVKDERDGVWVTGLPPVLDVITLGQENVKAGQLVDAKEAEGEDA